MKILHINKYPSIKGGSEVVLFDTIRLLQSTGHESILFSTDEGDISFHPTYTIHYPDKNASTIDKVKKLSSFFYNRDASKRLVNIIKTEKPDIAHIHLYLNGLSVSILPILKKYNIPVVMTLHEYRQICPSYLLLDRHQNICEKCINGNYLNAMLTRCAKGNFTRSALLSAEMYYRRWFYKTEKYVDKFICVSNFMSEKHKEFNRSISDKSTVIYNPVKQHQIGEIKRGNYLLYFGRLSVEKGLNTLLAAMQDIPHIKLKIAGTGDLKLATVPSNVEFLGFKDTKELKQLISDAMYTIFPSEWYETFGLSCAESLSLGTPVIASDIGAIPEIISHNGNGFLFTPKDVNGLIKTIKCAIDLPADEYISMAQRGVNSITKFSEQHYISKLLDLYSDLVKRNQ